MTSRRGRLPSLLAFAAMAALTGVDASAHGGNFLGPPGKLPPGVPPPKDPVQNLWDTNLDVLVAQDPVAPITTDGAADPDLVRRRARESRVLPFLRTVLAGKLGNDPDLLAAAAIAIAKTTTEPSDVEALVLIARDPARPALLREAAALAPGLLRRTAAELRFDPGLLDKVRLSCLELFDGSVPAPKRQRCLSILAIGLLGDQPRRAGVDAGQPGLPALDVGRELISRVKASDDFEEQFALVVALGLQAPETVSPDTLDVLRHLASTGVYSHRARGPVIQGHAMIALARLTGADASGTLLRFVRATHTDAFLRHAAMVGLGIVADRLPAVARTAAAGELVAHGDRGNPDTVGLALLTLGRMLAAAIRDPADRTTLGSPGAALLVRQIADGPGTARRIAALATGFALRAEPAPGMEGACAAFRRQAIAALTAVDDDGFDPALRGAAVLALGLSHDRAAVGRFTGLVGRRDVPPELRARAATALGVAGDRSAAPLGALRTAMDAQAPEGVRREAMRSLGFLGDATAIPALLAELRGEQSDTVRSRAATALGALRRPATAEPVMALAADRTANDLARAIAVAVLGMLTDPESIRSITLLASDFDRIVISDALQQALSLL